jgi:hypothetical protein
VAGPENRKLRLTEHALPTHSPVAEQSPTEGHLFGESQPLGRNRR